MNFMDVLGSVISGGMTGVLGSAVTSFIDYKTKKLQFLHEEAMEKATQETMRLEWEGRSKVAIVEGETQKNVAESEAFLESIKADQATYSSGIEYNKIKLGWLYAFLMVLIDFLRGIIRPASTIAFVVMTFWIYASIQGKINVIPTDSTAMMDLFNQVTTVILYLSVTTVCWWFGVRGVSKIK